MGGVIPGDKRDRGISNYDIDYIGSEWFDPRTLKSYCSVEGY